MALSGIAIVGFVLVHLVGTLKIFLGPEETNAYGEALRELGGHLVPRTHLLWLLRLGLLGAFGVHIHAAYSLDRRNRRARGKQRYDKRSYAAATYASRTVLWSGIIVGLFIIFHIADLTWGATNPDFVHGDAYNNQIDSFSNPVVVLIYLVALVALVLHLHHGLSSLFQSVGSRSAWITETVRRRLAAFTSLAIGLGYASIPLAVQVGYLNHSS
jgi:succinate dehydrogenase / fumarate reductase cytochrome b subunit